MDLSTVPVHQRLDALLSKLDEATDDFDYQDFVTRRSHQKENGNYNHDDNYNEIADETEDEDENAKEDSELEVGDADENDRVDEGRPEIPDKERVVEGRAAERRDKQIEVEVERAARFRQERRAHAEDISAHTVKTRSVDSFLASLDQAEESDSDLEVVPNKLSKSVKIPKLSVNASDRKLAIERQKLQTLQLQQISSRKKAILQNLRAHGLDVDEVSKQLNAKRQHNAMSAEELFELERTRNEALKKEEYNGSDDSEPESVVRSRKIFSDSDDDELSQSENDGGETDNESEPESRIGRTGTQYIPPLNKQALAQALSVSSDEEEYALSNVDLSEGENWNILEGESAFGTTVVPDLAGLKNKDLTMSQHLAEVRKRYLDAQAKQRRKEQQTRRKMLEKSNFLEDQAEESDDEENGRLPRSGWDDDEAIYSDEDLDVDLQGLVNHGDVKTNKTELRRRFLEDEKLRDQKLVNKLVEGVHGGFRRRTHGENGRFLSDDDGFEDDTAEEHMQQYLKMIEARRKNKLVANDTGAGKLASSTKAAAFFTSISENLISRPMLHRKSSVQESLMFLRSVEKNYEPKHEPRLLVEEDAFHQNTAKDMELPKVCLAVRRSSTLRSMHTSNRAKRGSTYASHISATDLGRVKTVEILKSLKRRTEPKRVIERFVAPTPAPQPKRPRRLVSTASKASKSLFKRSWS